MAKPIKDTPTIKGKDAEVFHKKMKENQNSRLSEEEVERIRNNYSRIKRLSNF